MIIDEIRDIKESKKDLKKFGRTVGIALIILAALLLVEHKSSFGYFAAIGVLLVLAAAIAPSILKPFNKVWMTLAVILGWIMTRVILIILFYAALTTIGLLARIFRKDFLDKRKRAYKDTYWQKREKKKVSQVDLERQF